IISIFSNAKPPVRIKKIAAEIEDACGYDPRNEKPEDFESALWQLDLPDLQEILTKIKAIK
ncbi:MAG TPA: hypothetical protein P5509_09965, partial [Bacteroidales bacterium]|nr:hypothetical protein [Bacteroidales bacterium]